MNKDLLRQIITLLTVILTLVINTLANILPLNGQNTGEISDRFQVYFVPAGYVFSIWFIIYVGLIAFAIYQALPSQRENPRLRRVGYWFALSGIANSAWIFCWHYNLFTLSLVVMLALLVSLIVTYLRLDIGRTIVSTTEKWCLNIPTSVYLGWISVATIANVTDVLYDLNWDSWGLSPTTWAVIMLVVATFIAVMIAVTRRDLAFLLVFVWSFIGIAVKQSGTSSVAITGWALSGLLVLIIIYLLITRTTRLETQSPLRT
jgi:translocator protein